MKALRVSIELRPVLASLALCLCATLPAKAVEGIAVQVDQARVVELPSGASTLIVGNPAIADVTVLRQANAMVITGKSYGSTNFLALDKAGKPVAESNIVVRNNPGMVLVQRGSKRQSYSCAPNCLPSVQLGDDTEIFQGVTTQIEKRNQMATPAGR